MTVLREERNGAIPEESLCFTCTHGLVVQGFLQNHRVTICLRVYDVWQVPFPVRKCSDYQDRRRCDLREMKEVAHVLVRGQRGKQVGFVTPDQYRELETDDEG